jgi:hypothetical protein
MRTLRKKMMPKVAVVVLLMMGAVFTMGAFMAAGAVEATNDNNNETATTTNNDDAAGDDEIMSDSSSSSSYTTISFGSSPSTTTTTSTSPPFSTDSECDPSYPDNCIPPPPPILTCDDISFRKFEVVGTDPHGFDGDKDGIGCEVPPATAITPFQAQQQQQQEPQQQNQTQNRTPTTTTANTNTNATTTTKTDGLLTTSINGTRFTTNQTILVNGTVGEAAGAGGVLYIELRNPQNETLLYESINMTTGTFDTPFSYRLVAGDLEKNSGASRTIFKPMNETGDNYMMTVGYDGTASNNSRSEVQFVFAYEHLAPEGEERAAVGTTTTPAEEPEPEPEVEPEEPEEEESEDDGDDCDNSYPDVCIPPPPPDLDCGDIDEENFEVRGSNPHGFDDDNDGVGCEEDDSTTSLEEEPEPEEEPLSELERLLEEREEQEVEEE